MLRTFCEKCGYDATYYQPKHHYPKNRAYNEPYNRCDGKFVTKDIPTEQEKIHALWGTYYKMPMLRDFQDVNDYDTALFAWCVEMEKLFCALGETPASHGKLKSIEVAKP